MINETKNLSSLKKINFNKVKTLDLEETLSSNYVYFLYKDGVIVYIGKSINHPRQRIRAHISTDKAFDRFYVIKIGNYFEASGNQSRPDLATFEACMILKYKPIYNIEVPWNNVWMDEFDVKKAAMIEWRNWRKIEVHLDKKKCTTVFNGKTYYNLPNVKFQIKKLNL